LLVKPAGARRFIMGFAAIRQTMTRHSEIRRKVLKYGKYGIDLNQTAI